MTQSELNQSAAGVRLARELHDGIAQDLVGVGYSLDIVWIYYWQIQKPQSMPDPN